MRLRACLLLALLLAASAPATVLTAPRPAPLTVEGSHKVSAAYGWLDVALEATAREHERHAP
ncbi:MAG TPA: hypothetical protein VD968_13000, partial [Pyrinomonadaceae bacterium]|nr:hypothetical protein [Pyrinomonadaceae bacterium]